MTDAAPAAPARRAAADLPTSPTTPVRPHSHDRGQDRSTRPADRGRLQLSRAVVEKIAGQAASEVAAAGASSGGFLGLGAHTDLSARPKVDAELHGSTATLELDLTVAYPTPIRQTADRVRSHLRERVEQLTGVQVTRVDINVTATHRPEQRPSDDRPDSSQAPTRRNLR